MDNIERHVYNTFIKQGNVIYDIGAFDGEMSMFFSSFEDSTVYAFEPSVFNFNRLINNISSYSNIKAFNVALNDKAYNCVTRFRDCFDGNTNNEQPISYVLLSDFIVDQKLKMPDFIKIDIEGMESIILNDFHMLLQTQRPIVFVEIHAAHKNSPLEYENNPHWKWPDEGGFDFNVLKQYNYVYLDVHLNLISDQLDYNPQPGDYKHAVLVPAEKYKQL